MPDTIQAAPVWKRVLAAILDFFTIFFGVGMLIALASGQTTSSGFNLSGWTALLLFALIVAYFVVGRKYVGGTIWDRIFGIRRPQPN
jgi:hypothetical protein